MTHVTFLSQLKPLGELMELLKQFIDIFLHLDAHLAEIIGEYGTTTYLILALVIFAETGLVVTPFLPGDSLLFAAGALAGSTGVLSPHVLFILLTVAGIVGDTVNYHVGKYIGPRVFNERMRFLKHEHLVRTQQFYERHGGKTIIFARFVPIIRTFAPFVAGVGTMSYSRFLAYNVIGAIAWVGSFTYMGYYFGNHPLVKKNFTFVVLAIIVISVLPAVYELVRHKLESRNSPPAPPSQA